jgi:hypothetical protein
MSSKYHRGDVIMKHKLFLHAGLLGALLSLGANQLYAGDVGSVSVASYNDATTVTGPATPDPAALQKLFHSPEFNVIDPVNESALDWNGFTPLGDTVTHEMREATERAAAKAAAEFEEIVSAGLY